MLKIIGFLLFLMPLCFISNLFWLVQNLIFLLGFIMIIMNYFTNYFMSLNYFLGCDLLSYGMMILSVWIIGLMFMASSLIYYQNNFISLFKLNILMLLLLLILSFSVTNLFLFYLFFESSLIPTLLLIMGWGYQPERLQAGVYLLFYTLLASLPLLICIFYLYKVNFSLSFYNLNINLNYSMLYLGMMMAFLVKMPMYGVHLWLPKAHVEAPVSGSMILAGVLLKLGGYGLLRSLMVIQLMVVKFSYIWVSISLVGAFIVSLMCLRQVDLKMLIAYSSVAHMGIVVSGMMTLSSWGFFGSYGLMISHGLCSSGLFCLANIIYERSMSRSMMVNKGFISFMPNMALWWFLLSSANMAAPPSLNLLSEIALINAVVAWSFMSMIILGLVSFFSAIYTLYLYSYTQHGKYYAGIYSFSSGYVREYLLLFLHWLPLNFLVMKSELFFLY